jgi:AcrR family transcriptional regulator
MEVREKRRALMDSTIHVVAQGDFDGATTRAISSGAGLNDAYIYRLFGSKENLFKTTFLDLCRKMSSTLLRNMPILTWENIDLKERCWIYFSRIWERVSSNCDECLFFIRYYNSAYFKDCSSEERKKEYEPFIQKVSSFFERGIDVWTEINWIFDIIFAAAIKVARGDIANDEATAQSVFEMICLMESSKMRLPCSDTYVMQFNNIERACVQ